MIKEISKILANITSVDETEKFLAEILTPCEISDLEKRWRILDMLNRGFSQRKIAKELNVSLCKITRGAKILNNEGSISQKYLRRKEND